MTHDDVVKLYASYGIKASFDLQFVRSGFVYDNNEVALKGDFHNLPVSLHDLAHWIVATPQDRARPNFNLGLHPNGWDFCSVEPDFSYKFPEADIWEARASELNVIMATYYFGAVAGEKQQNTFSLTTSTHGPTMSSFGCGTWV
jgi:hypothetical protein